MIITDETTSQELKEATLRYLNSREFTTDLSGYYVDKLFGLSVSEVRRQCEATTDIKLFDQPLRLSKDSMDIVLEGGEEILEDAAVLKMMNRIYRGSGK